MKKILLALAAVATIFAGCDKGLEDRVSNLENRVSEIEALLTELDVRVKGINTIVSDLQKNVYVTDVKPVEENGDVIGYTLTFTEGEPVTIYHGVKGDKGEPGDKGETLTIDWFDADGEEGPEDGDWYWKDKEGWLTDDQGNKIPAVKPLDFEIKEGVLWVKVGNVEEELGSVHGDSWFDDVVVDNEAGTVTIVIPGASQHLVLPFNAAAADGFALNLQLPGNTDILLGGTINIGYTLTGCAAADAAVFVQTPEDWTAVLDETNRKITLTVGEKSGRVVVYAINNETGEIKAKFVNYDREKMFVIGKDKSEFYLSPAGGKITIPISTGISYRIDENYDWLNVVKTTKAFERTEITFEAEANTTGMVRDADVNLWTSDGQTLLFTFEVSQQSIVRELLWDENGDPVKWQETFDLKVGSTTTAKKHDVTIKLSDDPSKGTYLINMFVADLFIIDNRNVYNEGASYYADENNGVLTVYKASKSYSFDSDISLAIDLSAMTLTGPNMIDCYNYNRTEDMQILDYKIAVKSESAGGSPLDGEWNQTVEWSYWTPAYAKMNIDVDGTTVTITNFLTQGTNAIGVLSEKKITMSKGTSIQTAGTLDSDVVLTISDDNTTITASNFSIGGWINVTSFKATK